GQDPVADFLKCALVAGLDFLHSEDDVAAFGVDRETQIANPLGENGVFDILGVAQLDERVVGGDRAGFADSEVVLFGQIVKGDLFGLADGRGKLVGQATGGLVGLGEHQRGLDGVLDFFKRLRVGGFLVEDLDNVEAVLGLDQVRDAALGLRERGGLELLDGLTLNDPAQVAAFVLGARILGIFLGEIFKLRAGLFGLFEDIFCFLLDFGYFGVGLADSHQQDVLHVDAVGYLILLDVALILGP